MMFIHWIGDFVLQTEYEATHKSTENRALLSHTLHYTMTWICAMFIWSVYQNHIGHITMVQVGWSPWVLLFFPITFVVHTITDYFTSRLNTYLWNKKDFHNLFVSVGFDQLLHFVQLYFTYYLLKSI